MFDRLPEEIVSFIFALANRSTFRTMVVPHILRVSQARLRRLYVPWLHKTHLVVFGNTSLPQSTFQRIMDDAVTEHYLFSSSSVYFSEDHFEAAQVKDQARFLLSEKFILSMLIPSRSLVRG